MDWKKITLNLFGVKFFLKIILLALNIKKSRDTQYFKAKKEKRKKMQPLLVIWHNNFINKG